MSRHSRTLNNMEYRRRIESHTSITDAVTTLRL